MFIYFRSSPPILYFDAVLLPLAFASQRNSVDVGEYYETMNW
jgi:hypothetical protein